MARPRVLVLSLDAVGPRMTGIAIRAMEVAGALSAHADVTVAAARTHGRVEADFPVVAFDRHDGRSLRAHLRGVDAVVAQPQWPLVARELERSGARLVFDLSCPEPIETLAFRARDQRAKRALITAMTVDRLVEALRIGHHFVASTDRQLDLWLGVMLAERLLSPALYDADPTLASRMALVPHGLPAEPPRPTGGPGLRGALPELPDGAEVVLWYSAIWQWFDPATAIRAMALLSERRPNARLVFLSPADQPAGRAAHARAKDLASELGLLGRTVHFHEQRFAYEERADWLLAASCAVSCHERHLETRFSFRTRYLDCFWAGLPIVCTEGDALAGEIARDGLGETVPERDPAALAAALERVLAQGRGAFAPALAAAAARFAWPVTTAPLLRLLRDEPLPPRLGAGAPRRPGHRARSAGYGAVQGLLNRTGLRGPRGLA